MENKFTATTDVWFIVKSGKNVHHGKMKSGDTVATINEIVTYETEESWKEALAELKVEVKDLTSTDFSNYLPK
jgi:hypothetical protein